MKKAKSDKLTSVTAEDKALNEAIDTVYRKYGTDLRSFFRDVRNDLALKRQDSSEAINRPRSVPSR